MNEKNSTFINQTVLTTPKPRASSTVTKKQQRVTMENDESSLGLLRIDEMNTFVEDDLANNLSKQKQLAQNVLERSGLPSRYFQSESPMQSASTISRVDSTINETDLLKHGKSSISSQSFHPNNVSTPRSSSGQKKVVDDSFFQNISQTADKLRCSDASVKALCTDLSRFSLLSLPSTRNSEISASQSFTPGELMNEILLKDEESWRRAKDLPIGTAQKMNFDETGVLQGKISMGEFFKAKSNKIKEIFDETSPEKQSPVPLIEITNTILATLDETRKDETHESETLQSKVEEESSVLSISKIQDILNKFNGESPNTVVDHLMRNKKRASKIKNVDKINTAESLGRFSSAEECDKRDTKSPKPREGGVPKFILSSSSPIDKIECYRESEDFDIKDTSKENVPSIKSPTMDRCGSSLESLPAEKYPIKGSKIELIWGCVKIGKYSTQEFCIRNQLNQKIRMLAVLTGSSFRIMKDRGDSDMLTSMAFFLHPLETKPISIMFCPTTIGAVAEKLNFIPVSRGESLHSMKKSVMLYGYGGHANVDVSNVAKDSHGKLWLSLGILEYKPFITQQFIVKNNGVLPGFASIYTAVEVISNSSDFDINPKDFVIYPQEQVTVTVTYSPTYFDYKNLQDIIEVGTIKLIMGAQATRARLKRLHAFPHDTEQPADPTMSRLTKMFLNERTQNDINVMKESRGAIRELLQQLQIKEIKVTVERDPNSTLVGPPGNLEDTVMFHTLIESSSLAISIDAQKPSEAKFRVEPNNVLLSLPIKKEDNVLLYSNHASTVPFKIVSECDDIVVAPNDGNIAPGETVVLYLKCKKIPAKQNNVRVFIHAGKEVLEVNVKIVLIMTKQ